MTLHPAVRLDNLRRISGRREYLRDEGIRVQGDRRDQLLDLLRRELRGRCWCLCLHVGLARGTVVVGLRSELHKHTAENYGQNPFGHLLHVHANSPVLQNRDFHAGLKPLFKKIHKSSSTR